MLEYRLAVLKSHGQLSKLSGAVTLPLEAFNHRYRGNVGGTHRQAKSARDFTWFCPREAGVFCLRQIVGLQQLFASALALSGLVVVRHRETEVPTDRSSAEHIL